MRTVYSRLAIAAFLTLVCSVPALADTVRTSVGLTIDALSGKHEIAEGRVDNISFVPIPIIELESRYRRTQVRLENIPSVPFTHGDRNSQSTRLGVLNTSIRQFVGQNWFVGLGETLYNQHTFYPVDFNADGSSEQYSRVAGASVEIGRTFALPHASTLELRLGGNPSMHGVQYSRGRSTICVPIGNGVVVPSCFVYRVSAVAERAVQVDLGLRLMRPLWRGDAILGIRYLNYSAHYVTGNVYYGDTQLADRNVGILPLIGYRLRL